MNQSTYVTTATEENFQQVVLQQSHQQPVLVDFWADWCAPCKMLMPLLEQQADAYAGAFVLAKVNSDEQQTLAAQYGVRSLPTVKLFINGEVVDEFTGALPESQIKEFLGKHITSESDVIILSAKAALEKGDLDSAHTQFESVLTKAYHFDAIIGLATIALAQQDQTLAEKRLSEVTSDDQENPEFVAIKARLAFQLNSNDSIEELLAAIATDPENLDHQLALGNAQIANEEIEAGMQSFIEIIKRDRNYGDDAGRSALLNVFNMLGSADPRVKQYRRVLASALN